MISQIGGGNQPVARKLFLECEVPLLHIFRIGMQLVGAEATFELIKGDVARGWDRLRIRIGTILRASPRIGQAGRVGDAGGKLERIEVFWSTPRSPMS